MSFEPSEMRRLGATCGEHGEPPIALVRLSTVDEIQQLVRFASAAGVAIHPISRGRNWGYGCSAPIRSQNIVLDLSRMDRIIEVNHELGYAVIEPGVSQGALSAYLRELELPLVLDTTGAPPEASVLANALERGYGLGAYSDHFLHSCALQVVLASGELLETGFGHYSRAKSTNVFKWGIGPWLDGLFSQSSYGIVTRMTVWLVRKAPLSVGFSVSLPDDAAFYRLVDRWREVRLTGAFPGQIRFANDVRMFSSFETCPEDLLGVPGALPEERRLALRKRLGLGAWNAFGSFAGEPELVRAQVRTLRRICSGIGRVECFSESSLARARKLERFLPRSARGRMRRNNALLDLVRGVPTPVPVRGCYFRKPPAHGMFDDPVRDRCGLLWCAPILPAGSTHLARWLVKVEQIFERNGLETNVGIVSVNDRAVCTTISIVFDQDRDGELERARACHFELLEAALEHGYPPYRFSTDVDEAREMLFSEADPYWTLCRQLKRFFDPGGIISPGRYGMD